LNPIGATFMFFNLILARCGMHVRGGGNGNDRIHGMAAENGNGLCGEGRMRKTVREWEWQNTEWQPTPYRLNK
jgi:hypothetical protein